MDAEHPPHPKGPRIRDIYIYIYNIQVSWGSLADLETRKLKNMYRYMIDDSIVYISGLGRESFLYIFESYVFCFSEVGGCNIHLVIFFKQSKANKQSKQGTSKAGQSRPQSPGCSRLVVDGK